MATSMAGSYTHTMKLISGNSNRGLSEAISAYLDVPLTQCNIKRFNDMEVFVEIMENVRGKDAFFIQSTSYPANDHLMELLIAIDATRLGAALKWEPSRGGNLFPHLYGPLPMSAVLHSEVLTIDENGQVIIP